MKFAREFQEALRREGFPPHWVESAIPYGQLKKCIKKVQRELADLGLDSVTLSQLNTASEELQKPAFPRRSRDDSPVSFQYDFAGMIYSSTGHEVYIANE